MLSHKLVETRRDRMELAREAGLGRVSFVSTLTGTLVAYGSFAVIAALAAVALTSVGVDTSALSANDWRQLGIGGAVVVGTVLFLSYFFGGYTAGRMARRSGAANGLLVFVLGLAVAGALGTLAGSQAGTEEVLANLRSLGVPTSGAEYGALASLAGLGALAAMIAGSAIGGAAGERWHGKLVARATTGAGTGTEDHDAGIDLRDTSAEARDRVGERAGSTR